MARTLAFAPDACAGDEKVWISDDFDDPLPWDVAPG
jgi:hypothetical protein